MGMADAHHDEYGPGSGPTVVSELACAIDGTFIDVRLGDRLKAIHGGADTVRELATCNFGVAPAIQPALHESGLRIAAVDDAGEMRAFERADHPFFVGTLYVPQMAPQPHPLFEAFRRAVG